MTIHRQRGSLSELAQTNRDVSDSDEAAQNTRDSEVVAGQIDINSYRLKQLDDALLKIEGGTYGICFDCGDAISAKRLIALPMATKCIECKREGEQRSSLHPRSR